jgi:serine-type D-Ala-D-Ala carboxypeptidase (penicillin-binding protein 5/6)
MISLRAFFICLCIVPTLSWAARTPLSVISGDPYVSALVLEADSGKVLFNENANAKVYPASVLKLMDLYVILDRIEHGTLRLDDMVQVTAEASKTGGSQVYLDPKEQFSVDDLLYALMVQSANDAAVALAIHVAGSKEGFVALMNQKAQELGMKSTRFNSVHGLPPSEGQEPDVTTASDFGILCRALAKKPETFKYTGTQSRGFREDKFIMRNHNKLLTQVGGCDGFKTGYFEAAGFSIAATAQKGGVRIIALVMGSKDRKVRDAKAAELLGKGFALIPPKPEAVSAAAAPSVKSQPQAAVPVEKGIAMQMSPPSSESAPVPREESASPEQTGATPIQESAKRGAGSFFIGIGVGFVLFLLLFVVAGFWIKKRGENKSRYIRRG